MHGPHRPQHSRRYMRAVPRPERAARTGTKGLYFASCIVTPPVYTGAKMVDLRDASA